MGVQRTTAQREYLKSRNTSAAYAKKVNLMTPDQVDAAYKEAKSANSSRRSTK